MEENLDIPKLLKTCIILLEYSKEKTLSAKTIQSAFNIIYTDDNEILNQGIMVSTDTKINTFNHYKNVLRNFMQNDIYKEYRLGSNSIPYLCEKFNFL